MIHSERFMIGFALCCVLQAQTPSGLLTGPVTYTSNLTSGAAYGNALFHKVDGTVCSEFAPNPLPPDWSQCYLVHYIAGFPYGNLQASDGTATGIPNCYTWDVWQLILNDQGYCQSSFHGGAPGEQRVSLYCGNSISSDIEGIYSLSCTAGFGGTAIIVENGVDVPISTLYAINVQITHHPVQVWIAMRYSRQLQTWQQIDSMIVAVTPLTN